MNAARLQIFVSRVPSKLVRSRCSQIWLRALSTSPSRTYATHREPAIPSSLLSQVLDQKQRSARREDNVGPFQLGLVPPTESEVGNMKKWSELSTGGKVGRATARTTNLIVILFGAGFSAMLIYALTSELFSKNSPTVLYSEACERIKSSPRVAKYLQGPLSFHNNPPSAARPRHRNHHVSSQIAVDPTGREHMFLNFYVQGRTPGSSSTDQDSSYFELLANWTKDKSSVLSELNWDDFVHGAKERSSVALESAKGLFRYLSGTPTPTSTQVASVPLDQLEKTPEKEAQGGIWSLAGVFGMLKSKASGGPGEDSLGSVDGKTWTEGEVHAELIRNDQGYFVFRYILLEIPNSSARNRVRVFVDQTGDVRESEPIIRWRS